MNVRARVVALVLSGVVLWVNVPADAEDVHLRAAGPVGIGFVGMYYGLVDPADDSWYEGENFIGETSTTWLAVADTGASASILGKSVQDAYASGTAIPLQPYPAVKFTDVGFGGSVDFAVTEPVRPMIADFKTADTDAENLSLYTAYGPISGPEPPAIKMAAALDLIGGGVLGIDVDIIGMSVMEGRILHVDPHYLQSMRLLYTVMAGSLEKTPPLPGGQVLYVPMTMQDYFTEPQSVDVGPHPTLQVHVRGEASGDFAKMTAFFDTGSQVNFISESFAIDAGIDFSSPFMSIPVGGVGGTVTMRDGYMVDALALELGADREGDYLLIANTAFFVIPDADMPGGLEAILGNGILSHSAYYEDTTVVEWYVDMRDGENAHLIVVIPEPALGMLLVFAFPVLLRKK